MPHSLKLRPFIAALTVGVLLSGCESIEVDHDTTAGRNINQSGSQRALSPLDKTPTTLFSDDGLSFGGSSAPQGAQLPVNKHLWRSTLDVLSILPLSSTDPYGGVIVTDWGTMPDAPQDRFKVTAYITSAALKPQSLNVVVNRQVRGRSGSWQSAPVSEQTKRDLEDAILTRARQLRSGEDDAG